MSTSKNNQKNNESSAPKIKWKNRKEYCIDGRCYATQNKKNKGCYDDKDDKYIYYDESCHFSNKKYKGSCINSLTAHACIHMGSEDPDEKWYELSSVRDALANGDENFTIGELRNEIKNKRDDVEKLYEKIAKEAIANPSCSYYQYHKKHKWSTNYIGSSIKGEGIFIATEEDEEGNVSIRTAYRPVADNATLLHCFKQLLKELESQQIKDFTWIKEPLGIDNETEELYKKICRIKGIKTNNGEDNNNLNLNRNESQDMSRKLNIFFFLYHEIGRLNVGNKKFADDSDYVEMAMMYVISKAVYSDNSGADNSGTENDESRKNYYDYLAENIESTMEKFYKLVEKELTDNMGKIEVLLVNRMEHAIKMVIRIIEINELLESEPDAKNEVFIYDENIFMFDYFISKLTFEAIQELKEESFKIQPEEFYSRIGKAVEKSNKEVKEWEDRKDVGAWNKIVNEFVSE